MQKKLTYKMPLEYVFLVLSFVLLLIGVVFFSIAPENLNIKEYQTPVYSFLLAISLTSIGNILIGFIQKGVSREANRALENPISNLDSAVGKLRQIQYFYENGVVGVYPNRAAALRKFKNAIELEDKNIDFVGTSMLGTIDPSEESSDKITMYNLLKKKKEQGNVRIRALLMHPAYGEFRERVEGRQKSAVAKDIQKTLEYVIIDSKKDKNKNNGIFNKSDVRLYPGLITAYGIFTSKSLLINMSTLDGPVYDNLTLIIEDTGDEKSIYKKLKEHHFEKPWGSDIIVRLDEEDSPLEDLLSIDFSKSENRFKEGNWPATIPSES